MSAWLPIVTCLVSALFGAMAMLTVVLFFTERREKKAERWKAEWIEQCYEASRDANAEATHWTPHGNE